jgi:hypothetical protein
LHDPMEVDAHSPERNDGLKADGPDPEPEWDEGQLLSSMARLQEMHIQVPPFRLRETES